MCPYLPGYWYHCPHCEELEFFSYNRPISYREVSPANLPEHICPCDGERAFWWDIHRPRPFAFSRYCIACRRDIIETREQTGARPAWFDVDSQVHPRRQDYSQPTWFPHPDDVFDNEPVEPVRASSEQDGPAPDDSQQESSSSGSDSTVRQFNLASENRSPSDASTEVQFYNIEAEEYYDDPRFDGHLFRDHLLYTPMPTYADERDPGVIWNGDEWVHANLVYREGSGWEDTRRMSVEQRMHLMNLND